MGWSLITVYFLLVACILLAVVDRQHNERER